MDILPPLKKKSRLFRCRVSDSDTVLGVDNHAPWNKQRFVGVPYIEFDLIQTHLRYLNKKDDKVIGQQIVGSFPELSFQNHQEQGYINKGDMMFWFNEPVIGWRQGITRYYFLEEIPVEKFSWPKLPKIFDGTIRKSLEDFTEGDMVAGVSESIHLNHGILIDFGCEYLGLLPMDEFAWKKLSCRLPYTKYQELRPDFDSLQPENKATIFKCKIRRKLDPDYARWPIELDIVDPSWLSDYIIPIKEHEPRILAVAEFRSTFSVRDYGSLIGRPYRAPRCYAYTHKDSMNNRAWIQTHFDYFPTDHAQQFMRNDLSSLHSILDLHQYRCVHNLDTGKILRESGEFFTQF